MSPKRKYEVRGVDSNGDLWIVATDSRETAEQLAEKFRNDGYADVWIAEN